MYRVPEVRDYQFSSEVLDEFVTSASFETPLRIIPSAWVEHAPFVFWLIDTLKPRCLVELGVFYGYSYLAMCQAAARLKPPPHCCGVDTWVGDEHAGFYPVDVFNQLRRYHDIRYGTFSRLTRATFDEAVLQFEDGSVDLLHIDGRHFYEDVKHDFKTWRPKLSKRAVVLFHDTRVRERDFGVWQLWEELAAHYPSFEFHHGYGLGVLGYGAEVPATLRRLFSTERNDIGDATREAYCRLGAVLGERMKIQMHADELRHIRSDLRLGVGAA
jgi:hypothetical protein